MSILFPNDYRICDSHTHIFPPKLANKATDNIGEFYSIKMHHTAVSEELISSEHTLGTKRMLVCAAASTPHQVCSINDFIAEECRLHPMYVGFGTLHPKMDDPEEEISRMKELKLVGIKLHPEFQSFYIDEPETRVLYQAAERAGMPILFHMGDEHSDLSHPMRLREVLRRNKDLVAIAAHFGAYSLWSEADMYPQSERLYFDTSSSLFKLPEERAVELIRHYGAKQFMFGTDFPMWDPFEEFCRFMRLPLTEAERQRIFSGTFDSLFPEE